MAFIRNECDANDFNVNYFDVRSALGAAPQAVAQVEDCPNYKVSTESLPALHLNQPTQGGCYAVVIGDLLSSELGQPVSSVAIVNFSERVEDSLRNKWNLYLYKETSQLHRFSPFGKKYSEAISAIKQLGFCSYSVLDRARASNLINTSYLDSIFYELEQVRRQNSSQLKQRLKDLFDSYQNDYADLLFTQSQKNSTPLIDLAVNLSCMKPMKLPSMQLYREDNGKSEHHNIQNKIETLLQRKKLIAIGYDSRLFKNPQLATSESAHHASLLVEQFFDSSQKVCKFKIRATDLSTCQYADASVNCMNGYFTVDRTKALEAIGEINWIERKP